MPHKESASLASLRLWKELERLARCAEGNRNRTLVAYFRGMSPAPEAEDYAVAKRARALAKHQFRQMLTDVPRRPYRSPR
ncbi:hypothetical protein J2X67_005433 [Variovorax sp. 3319]|nr:hypothetical protein [Variovorax sp. 3319]